MKLTFKIIGLFVMIIAFWLIAIQFQTYSYPTDSELNERVNYLEKVINEPLEKGYEIFELGRENYEWMLFSYSYTSYSLTNIAVNDSSFQNRAIKIIRSSIEKVLEHAVYSPYGIHLEKLYSDSLPDYSVLYLGHLNLMLGNYRLLSSDTTFDSLNDNISKSLFERYSETSFINLESYPYSIWIPDNTVALASLKLHSLNTGSNYETMCSKWVEYSKKNYIESNTGTLYSMVDPTMGHLFEEPRGSMLGWSINFIYQFDEEFAKELYQNYKDHFSHNYIVFRLFKERYNSYETNPGDIDSGPILFGFSIPANEFALGNAVLSKDYKTARRIIRLINSGTKTITKDDEIRYQLRFLDLKISPMAEALVLYALTNTKWVNE